MIIINVENSLSCSLGEQSFKIITNRTDPKLLIEQFRDWK